MNALEVISAIEQEYSLFGDEDEISLETLRELLCKLKEKATGTSNYCHIINMDIDELSEFLCELMCAECCETTCPATHKCSRDSNGMKKWLESSANGT